MKSQVLSLLLLIMPISLNAQNDTEIGHSKLNNDLLNMISFGTYVGEDNQGDQCIMSVTKGNIPDGKNIPSTYFLSLTSVNNYGEFYTLSNFTNSGRGDCPVVAISSDRLLEVQNRGEYAPCFSSSKKSSTKGLGVYKALNGYMQIATYSYYFQEEMTCHFKID
jgi:hypothetical protein